VGLNNWEDGISICRVTQLSDGKFEVGFECKKVSGADAEALVAALGEAKLLSGARDLVRMQEAVLQAVNANLTFL
jgi:hypothetical protein